MSAKIEALLSELNSARVINGKPSLKSWKDSTAKLTAAIEAERKVIDAAGADIVAKQIEENKKSNAKIARTDVEVQEAAKAAVKKMYAPRKSATEKAAREATVTRLAKELGDKKRTTRPIATKKASPALKAAIKNGKNLKAHKTGAINVADIASELGINAKVARATLRRKGIDRTDEKAIRAALAKK